MELGALSILMLIAAGVTFGVVALLIAKIFSPSSTNAQKGDPYECGVPSKGTAWVQFRISYYIFALLFLLFDVEVVFLFPWAVAAKELGMLAFVDIIIFMGLMFLGLLYAWKKGVLKWI
jgi:NADH:ubiquinone oxidoreductase subunit 3 (subunit A)